MLDINRVYLGDCLELMNGIIDGSERREVVPLS